MGHETVHPLVSDLQQLTNQITEYFTAIDLINLSKGFLIFFLFFVYCLSPGLIWSSFD